MNAGLRVDSVDEELLRLLKKAGCYQIALAPETRSEALLRAIKKGITLDQCRLAFALARKAGLETTALFMIALPGETLETLEQTIRFAIELSPSYAKVCFATPLPNTPLFDLLEAGGRIKTYDWSKYAFHEVSEVYDHPTLSWDQLRHSYDDFYRRWPRPFEWWKSSRHPRRGTSIPAHSSDDEELIGRDCRATFLSTRARCDPRPVTPTAPASGFASQPAPPP
jgi:radical SAM superfamily enzyme YgiQ (UPF0313 family)